MQNKENGFSMMEMVVVIGILGVLLGTLAPMGFKKLDQAKVARANSDIKVLASAVASFRQDNKEYPARRNSSTANYHHCLDSAGAAPGGTFSSYGRRSSIDNHLLQNLNGYPAWNMNIRIGWNGPYLDKNPTDPWGYRYMIAVRTLFESNTGCSGNECIPWVISAGADKTTNTDYAATVLAGDDIGLVIGAP